MKLINHVLGAEKKPSEILKSIDAPMDEISISAKIVEDHRSVSMIGDDINVKIVEERQFVCIRSGNLIAACVLIQSNLLSNSGLEAAVDQIKKIIDLTQIII